MYVVLTYILSILISIITVLLDPLVHITHRSYLHIFYDLQSGLIKTPTTLPSMDGLFSRTDTVLSKLF